MESFEAHNVFPLIPSQPRFAYFPRCYNVR